MVNYTPEVGDIVHVRDTGRFHRLNTNDRYNLDRTELLEVTRVFSTTVNVRTVNTKSHTYSGRYERMTFNLAFDQIELETPADPNRPVPRKLGKKPEDTEDMTYIGIDHPGLQWLWDDLGAFATKEGYCSHYDVLAAKLGIPGRPRDFNVSRAVNGINISTTVKARSQAEANRMVDVALGINQPKEEAPTDA